jgi:hypothetical protein
VKIPPPHSVAGVKCYICLRESIADSSRVTLFPDLASIVPLQDMARFEIMIPGGVGHAPGDPIALVSGQSSTTSNTEPVMGNSVPRKQRFDCTLKAFQRLPCGNDNCYLSFERGDILYTDGIPRGSK